MKALRYLLIVVVMVSFLGVKAQGLARQPEVYMQSTSGMVYSGSTLPSAAVQGTYVTGSTIGTYNPANASGPNRARRAADEDDDPDDPDTPPVDPHGPNENPLGDAAWLLILAAAVYGVYKRKLRVR